MAHPVTTLALVSFLCVSTMLSQDQGEMFLTRIGMIALTTPKGFAGVQGPMELLFTPEGKPFDQSRPFIYLASVDIGKKTKFKTAQAFIDFDVDSFRKRFPNGRTEAQPPIEIPHLKAKAPVWIFRSGESNNAFERLIFIEDSPQTLRLLVLSAPDSESFQAQSAAFNAFAKSFKGSIIMGTPSK